MDKKFTFGIYPGGIAGTDKETILTSGRPDNPRDIMKALDSIQNGVDNFWIR